MRVASLVHRLRQSVRDLWAAEDGNVAIIFTIALIPIIGLAGGAIDYGRASAVKTAMQAALDATALAMSKEASTLSAGELNDKAAAYFAAAFDRPEVQGIKIGATYSADDGSSVAVTGTGSIGTQFLGILGINEIPIGSYAKTAWGSTRLRVALVLDNTGSMASSSKMTALKTASKKLLTQLQNATSKPGDVYVSIIPFSKDVNVGSSNYTANWVGWRDWEEVNGKCSNKNYTTRSECAKNLKNWLPNNHTNWNGCVTDRDKDYDIKNTAPNPLDALLLPPLPSTLFPAEQYGSCPAALMPQSYDWTQLNQKIDDMYPAGTTNQPIGLAWGWMSLTESAPLNAPAKDPKFKYRDVIILFTDGMNTQNRWTSSQSSIDARQQMICDNIKAAKITIYTVLVMAGNSTVLQNCASDATKYFALTSAEQIITAFDAIGTNLAQLRIAY